MVALTCVFIINDCVDLCFCIMNGCVHCFNVGKKQKVFTAPCSLKFAYYLPVDKISFHQYSITLLHLCHGRVKGPLPLLWVDSRASRGKVTLCGTPTGLDCVICTI